MTLTSKSHHILAVLLVVLLLALPGSAYHYQFDYTFTSVDSEEEVSYSTYEGKPLLIDLFATWCEPCRVEILHIQSIYQSTDEIGVLSISIDPNTDSLEDIRDFRDEFNASWEFGLDHDQNFKNDENYNLTNLPYLLLLDETGQLVKDWQGVTAVSEVYDELESQFDIEVTAADSSQSDIEILIDQLFQNTAFRISAIITSVLVAVIVFSNLANRKSAGPIPTKEIDE